MEEVEKNNHVEELERVSTKDEHSRTNSLEKVQTQDTLAAVDLDNSQAFKGDESDGKIQWTIRKWFAAAFLAMLYTGMLGPPPDDDVEQSTDFAHRLANLAILHGSHFVIHFG